MTSGAAARRQASSLSGAVIARELCLFQGALKLVEELEPANDLACCASGRGELADRAVACGCHGEVELDVGAIGQSALPALGV